MRKLLPFLALLILFVWGCGKSEKKEEAQKSETTTDKKVVARVNERPIYENDLKGKPLEDVIDYEILYEVGLKQGLDKQVEKQLENYRKRLIIAALQKDIMANLPKEEVSEQEIEEYYKQNAGKYKYMSFKEIVVKDQNIANEIHKRALKGEDFEKIASDYSESGTNVQVRDLRFNKKYNERFIAKEIGSVSEIIQEGNNFVILKLTEVKEIPFNKTAPAIKYSIIATKRAQAVHNFAEKAKNENNIKVEILK